MDYFLPGLRELSRILGRQVLRLRMAVENRKLAKAETTLGLLGWQQADFDDATEAEVRRIVEFEREQADATNNSAVVGRELHEVKGARAVGRKHYERELRTLEDERRRITAGRPAVEHLLEEKRRTEPVLEQRMPELDRELRELSKRYATLLATDPPTSQTRQELLQVRERIVTIPNAKSELRMLHLRAVQEVRTLEGQLAKEDELLAEFARREHALAEAFEKADAELAARIHQMEQEVAGFDKAFESLESAKANPYREVGRVLADSGVGPLNQPHVLAAVQSQRAVVQEIEYALAASEAATASQNPLELRRSVFVWAGLGVGAIAFVIAVIVLG